jgi:tRNA (mo5U34)-methyltransferase
VTERDPRIDELYWYHTIDLGHGVKTPGEFDTEAALARIPFPKSLEGKRCLDVGTRDGFWAYTMEARGASEVVGIDVDHPTHFDNPWLPAEFRQRLVDAPVGVDSHAFHLAHELLDSKVQRVVTTVYDLNPEEHGTFDFAYMGTILLHLRDPIGALTAVRKVVTGQILVNDSITPDVLMGTRRPAARLQDFQAPFWWIPNAAALARYVEAAGFRITQGPVRYKLPIDERQKPGRYRNRGSLTRREWTHNKVRRGIAHAYILAEPNLG